MVRCRSTCGPDAVGIVGKGRRVYRESNAFPPGLGVTTRGRGGRPSVGDDTGPVPPSLAPVTVPPKAVGLGWCFSCANQCIALRLRDSMK